jgi:hypothetical protein
MKTLAGRILQGRTSAEAGTHADRALQRASRTNELRRTCSLIGSAAVALAVGAAGCGGNPAWPHPPRTAPVNSLVLVSANGRVLTARGVIACGHRPLLVARSYPDRVTLTWINPDTSCNAETIRPVTVSTSLPAPLGNQRWLAAHEEAA